MTIKLETQGRIEFPREPVEDVRGDFEGHVAHFTGHVGVGASREVVHGRRVTSVGVDDEVEAFEFFQDSIDGGGTHVGSKLLDPTCHLVGRYVIIGHDEDFDHGPLGSGDALGVAAQRVDHLFTVCAVEGHIPSV